MIDNPVQVERLIAKLRAALPLSATATPPLVALLKEQAAGIDLSPSCQITGIHYAGDEGGIVCKLDFGNEARTEGFLRLDHTPGLRSQAAPGAGDRGVSETPD